jgi:hypothetical protein
MSDISVMSRASTRRLTASGAVPIDVENMAEGREVKQARWEFGTDQSTRVVARFVAERVAVHVTGIVMGQVMVAVMVPVTAQVTAQVT